MTSSSTSATVQALIEAQATARPGQAYALAEDGTALSYADLAAGCRRIAGLLQARGVGPGQTVSVVMPNGLNTLRVQLATLWAGCCVNPVNLLAQPEQMAYVLGHSDCALVITSPDWVQRVQAMLDGLDRPVALLVAEPDALALPGEHDVQPAASTAGLPATAPTDTGLLMYTSGTTGRPKGVMLSQASLVANAQAIVAEHGLSAADRVLAVLPLYHINAFAVTMLAPLASGGSLVMPPRFSVARYWALALGLQCSWLNLVPTMVSYLLEAEAPDAATLRDIRFARSASAALPPEHLRGFEQRFGIGLVETMGLTETVAPCFSNPMDPAQRKLGSVGRASGCEAQVVDADLRPVADGTTGELCLRGPNVMLGYYKNPDATAASFTSDGWLRSGDLGHRDADGFYFVTGRIKELIIKGGENIAPREIDEVLLRHPAVLDAAAVGMPDRHYGQDILACVVLRDGQSVDEAGLRAFCEPLLGRYKTPKRICFVTELPRGPSGKVQRLKMLEPGFADLG